ncbi:MAG: ThuA domain-containing protein [Armatimonadota bacterium]|nr:ThuA domain-containing protein [Armatimonadota bacterium]
MKKALIVWGGWEGHEPKQCADIFAPILKAEGYDVTVSDTMDSYTDKDLMNSLSLVVPIWTMGNITGEQLGGLLEAVRNGVGIGGWHGGMGDSFRDQTEYQFMCGGQWVQHPGGEVEYEVHITNPFDPVTEGISDFKMKSEQYYMHVDPSNVVLATTTFSGDHLPWIKDTIMPAVWKRVYGRGRVFYTTLGHSAGDFDVPECLEITKRGLLWASK